MRVESFFVQTTGGPLADGEANEPSRGAGLWPSS